MPRSRVLSFMSQWGGGSPRSSTPDPTATVTTTAAENAPPRKQTSLDINTFSPSALQKKLEANAPSSPRSPTTPSRTRAESRTNTRPNSMIQTYQPPQVDVALDTPPELQPIFGFLNSHSNKLYQEGYFLKLHDLDTRGRPSSDRVWTECFAQLVGTVLSLWDATALDQVGEDGEVVPTFINLSDASLRMIESLPMNGAQGGTLQNVLSVSTAANNRYLLHFNSLNSLTQWTAGIRLAIYEHSTLQEAYTGSLIAGKGKYLNNIKQIMDRSRFVHEDWARVRFGAGTAWKRCWCVITPPDEKEYNKAQKTLKKSSTYTRAQIPKGDIKFYESRKITKKTRPIATIADAYAAYAIYPQSKPLIDQSTLVKLEGLVTTHGAQDTTTEGFVFVMPEVHPAVSGFEMMLRWLFPVYDTFALYGRPIRLIADTLDQRGLMFAMPSTRTYGYLDTLDVSGLIHTEGSQSWSERQWRREMKKLTATRMMTYLEGSPRNSRQLSQRRSTTSRTSLPPVRNGAVQFQEPGIQSSPGSRSGSPVRPWPTGSFVPPKRVDSAPPGVMLASPHKRSVSEAHGYRKYRNDTPSRLSQEHYRDELDEPPAPPKHAGALGAAIARATGVESPIDRSNTASPYERVAQSAVSPNLPPPEPVISPPAMQHMPNSRPPNAPFQAPELRRAHSNVDAATLYQMRDAARPAEDQESLKQYSPQDEQTVPFLNHSTGSEDPYRDVANDSLDYNGGRPRELRQRLSTIPGSPYASHSTGYFESPQQAQMSAMDNVIGAQQSRPELVQVRSSNSVARKPVPIQQPQTSTEAEQSAAHHQQPSQVRALESASPGSPASAAGSLLDAVVDQDALERLLNESERTNSIATSSTPDYASSLEQEVKPPVKEWTRPGKLKTVGHSDLPTIDPRSGGLGKHDTWSRDKAAENADTPVIDFGPTLTYKPTVRPGTSGTITQDGKDQSHSRSRSGDRLRQSSGSRLSGYFTTPSPGENNRQSYFGGRKAPTGLEGADSPGHRNSVAWIPGGVAGGGRSSPSLPNGAQQKRETLSPEEWVQYRAAVASQPRQGSPSQPYLHYRHASTNNIQQPRSFTPPPLLHRNSEDWAQHGRGSTPPSRPHSRDASALMNSSPVNSNNVGALTAREQMHIARATGTPLINMTLNGAKQQDGPQAPGLIGTLAARERERAALAQGVRSTVVQHAIAARQQEQARMDQEAQAQTQWEMQQRLQHQLFEQQMVYQQAVTRQQQMAAANEHGQHQQQQNVVVPMNHRSPYGHSRAQTMQFPAHYTVTQQPNAGGYGGQFVQQQGMPSSPQLPLPQQQQQQYHQHQQAYTGNYYTQQQQQGQSPWQARR